MRGSTIIFLVLVVVAVATAGYVYFAGRMRPSPSPASSAAVGPITPSSSSATSQTAGREVVVEGNEYSFKPASLTIAKGETIKLIFRNTGRTSHNLVINELKVATNTIGPGEETSVEVTGSQSGSFSMYCAVDGHRAFGMEGKVEVQ